MASIAGTFFSAPDTARSWIKALVASPADIIPDEQGKTLTVRVYPLGEERMNQMAEELFLTLNETQTPYPETDLILHYEMLKSQNETLKSQNETLKSQNEMLKSQNVPQTLFPRGQEV